MVNMMQREKGASAVVVAISMLVIMGFAALVIDLGAGFNQRAQDQSAADTGALAGAGNTLGGVAGVRDAALAYVQDNLDTTYSATDWQTSWEACTDAGKGAGFQAVDSPWTTGAKLDCISIDPIGIVRVRVPDQILSTTFGSVIGSSSLKTSAAAEATFGGLGVSGVLPFGLASDVGAAEHVCLSSSPTGLADDPCVGSDAGNFGTIKGREFGNALIGTSVNCTASPLGNTLAVNIAVGLDHWVTLAPGDSVTTEVRDYCFNLAVNTLNTDVGWPGNGAEEGLATGPVDGGLTPRLQQSTASHKTNRFTYSLDNEPFWYYLDSPSGSYRDFGEANFDGSIDFPRSCAGFDSAGYDWDGNGFVDPPKDWDGDGTVDSNESWQHMEACLDDYVNGNHYTSIMFVEDIKHSPRFGYVPQFFEDDLGDGSSWLHIKQFRAVWLQSTWWKKSAVDVKVFNPGEDCAGCEGASGYSMMQLSAFVVPDGALPETLRGDPPPDLPPGTTTLNPYEVQLYK
jgi:hypothetical protein